MAEWRTHKKKLKVPRNPFVHADGGDWHCKYDVMTHDMKVVFDFSGIDFSAQGELDAFDFWRLLREATIFNLSQTEKGRDYLDEAWALEQKEPDRKALRRIFGGKD